MSLGLSKADSNCQLLETARSYDSMNERLAGCKVKISSKISKKAGVTLEDCMAAELVVPVSTPVAVAPPTPVAPIILVQVPPQVAPVPFVAAPAVSRFEGFYTRFDNVAKARFDGTILMMKKDLDSHLRLHYNPANLAIATSIQAYLVANGIDQQRIELRDDGYEQGVEVLYMVQ
jgi:hypothetical protein